MKSGRFEDRAPLATAAVPATLARPAAARTVRLSPESSPARTDEVTMLIREAEEFTAALEAYWFKDACWLIPAGESGD